MVDAAGCSSMSMSTPLALSPSTVQPKRCSRRCLPSTSTCQCRASAPPALTLSSAAWQRWCEQVCTTICKKRTCSASCRRCGSWRARRQRDAGCCAMAWLAPACVTCFHHMTTVQSWFKNCCAAGSMKLSPMPTGRRRRRRLLRPVATAPSAPGHPSLLAAATPCRPWPASCPSCRRPAAAACR